MKKVRNNLWNRLFRSKELKKYKEWVKRVLGWHSQLLEDLRRAESLQDLIDVHKHAWEIGYQNYDLAPLEWGMFRCNSIPELTLDTLYLGDIHGLWTNTGKFWECHKHEEIGPNGYGFREDMLIYDIIVNQYKLILVKNINTIVDNIIKQTK